MLRPFFATPASAIVAFAALVTVPADAQVLSEADRAALQIQTAQGAPVHMGDTLEQVRAALPSAPPPQIPGRYATLWDQVDGIVLRLSNDVVADILYDPKTHATLAGLGVGIDSPLDNFERVLGPSVPGIFPDTYVWRLDAKHQLVATVNSTGIVRNLGFQIIPKPAPRPTTGMINWADRPVASASAPTVPASELRGDARRDRLDELLAQGNDGDLLQLLFPQFLHQPAPAQDVQAADLAWLEDHAAGGRASVLYALSWKLLPADRERAREMNARARVEWVLASVQCLRPPQPGPLAFALEGQAMVDVMPLRLDGPAWAQATERALTWDHSLPAPVEPDWYCGPDNVKMRAHAMTARQTTWQRMWDTNHAKLVPAGTAG